MYKAFASIKTNLKNISLFHTDRGNEFKNNLIEEVLNTFAIKRSLSMKGCPYDNAVAESTFKIIKTEFVRNYHFESLEELNIELADYVNWFNKKRIHSTLGYLRPYEYKFSNLKKTGVQSGHLFFLSINNHKNIFLLEYRMLSMFKNEGVRYFYRCPEWTPVTTNNHKNISRLSSSILNVKGGSVWRNIKFVG